MDSATKTYLAQQQNTWTPFDQPCETEFSRTNNLPSGVRLPFTIGDPKLEARQVNACQSEEAWAKGLVPMDWNNYRMYQKVVPIKHYSPSPGGAAPSRGEARGCWQY